MTKKAKADVWMPITIGDYLGDTGHLTTEQHGAYFLLMMHYWRKGPPAEHEVGPITRMDARAWKRTRSVLAAFFQVADGVWTHKRLDEERQAAAENKRIATERASAGGKAKAAKTKAASTPTSTAASSASSTLEAPAKQCPSPSPTEEEGAFSPHSSLSGGAVAPTSVPPFIIEKFLSLKDDGWVNSYIRPCSWDPERLTLRPATPFAGDKIRSEGRKGLIELEQAGHAVRVLEASAPGGAAQPAAAGKKSTN